MAANDVFTHMSPAEETSFQCPVCGYGALKEAPYDSSGSGSFEICPCCGFEFGYDDQSEGKSHADYRKDWLAKGAEWFMPQYKPKRWNLERQLSMLPNPGEADD